MKFNFLQGDFSGGELSPRAQGHVDSDTYKAGLGLASNVAPTRTGSIASRSGLKALLEGVDALIGDPSNLPVQHIDVHDGPFGDFIVEVSPTGLRLLDRGGVLPWNLPPTSEFVQFTTQDGVYAYGDPKDRTVYLRSYAPTPRSYYLTKGGGAQNALLPASKYLGEPIIPDGRWIFSGKIAGDTITAHIVQSDPANFQDFAVVPDASGNFSITFRPNIGGVDQDFYIQLVTDAGTTATNVWDINLTKIGAVTGLSSAGRRMPLSTGLTTPLTAPTFGGSNVAPTQERVRAAAFWAKDNFWVAFAGGQDNRYAGYCLRWKPGYTGAGSHGWEFGALPTTPHSLDKIVGANAVAVFQDRLWYGINLPNGARAIRASVVGYGSAWGFFTGVSLRNVNSVNTPQVNTRDWLFQFVVETETTIAAGIPAGVSDATTTYNFPLASQKLLQVKVNGQIRYGTDAATALTGGHELDYSMSNLIVPDVDNNPGGAIGWHVDTGALPQRLHNGDTIVITRDALADDPLDLSLASPTGRIAWLNVLRGLVLGTTRNEKVFQRGVSLAIDPATGQSFDIEDESSYGGDPALPALDINDKVLFVQQGRRVLRYAGISITTNGGLVSEDIGVVGEHLTKARMRSLCFLKSPVPRVVMAFDDGTGAVMTVLTNRSVAFSRLTIPACFGGLYSVAALNTDEDSELWVGTENGVTLWAATFESDITSKEIFIPAAYPAAPAHFKYDVETPLPPVMDGWQRLPLVYVAGVAYVAGLPACMVGQSVWALVNGQLYGPNPVAAGGKVVLSDIDPDLNTTWVDAAGNRRVQEVYVGIAFTEHRFTTLPLEGGNPVGSSQNLTSRKPQLYLRLVDSYLPLVNGTRLAERGADDAMDVLPERVTDDRRATEEGYQRGGVVDVVMDVPLRMEISAVHGGVVMNNI